MPHDKFQNVCNCFMFVFSLCLYLLLYIYLSEIGMLDCWPTALCHLTKQAPLRIKAEALFQVKAEGIRGELEIRAMMIT